MATAFVSEVHPAAAAYYRQARKEPIDPSGDLAITSIVSFNKAASVEDLLKLIAKGAKPGADILIHLEIAPGHCRLPDVPDRAEVEIGELSLKNLRGESELPAT